MTRTNSLAQASALALLATLAGCTEPSTMRRDGSVGDIDAGVSIDASRSDAPIPDGGFGPVCEATRATTEPLPTTLVFQLDTSGSMNCDADTRMCAVADPTPAPDDSRWDVMRARLREALVALPSSARVGLMHFPDRRSGCAPSAPDVAITDIESARPLIETATAALVPENITPTHDAVANAYALLRADGGDNPFLILATDGRATVCLGCDPGCSFDALDADDEQMVRDIASAATEGIRTFVIGVPGSQSYRAILSRMASAGDTERSAGCAPSGGAAGYCHFDLSDPAVDFAAGLSDALAAIGEVVITCEYAIPPNPEGSFDPARVNVRFVSPAGAELRRVRRDVSRADGWDYSDDGNTIILHGATCEEARTLSGTVEVLFGCPTELI